MNKIFAKELIQRSKIDQKMRMKNIDDGTYWDDSVDKSNTEYMKQKIKQVGWPKISDVGLEASNAAWLLVQHADHDLPFQKKCLKLMKALPKEEVSRSNIAYLEDRTLVAENKPQVYGTQFHTKANKLIPRKIEDISNLDIRRQEVGLEPFDKYKKIMNQKYGNNS